MDPAKIRSLRMSNVEHSNRGRCFFLGAGAADALLEVLVDPNCCCCWPRLGRYRWPPTLAEFQEAEDEAVEAVVVYEPDASAEFNPIECRKAAGGWRRKLSTFRSSSKSYLYNREVER